MDEDIIMIGPIRFNSRQLEVSAPGKTARLTPMEGRTLYFLATHANTVCTFSQINSEAYGFGNDDGSTALIKMHIRHLRQKIEQDPNNPIYILTVPVEGYKLVVNPD
jgi:DNA-binding response OmpR family regulator